MYLIIGATGNVVVLSSFGAERDAKTGPILGLHFLEERLKESSR